MTFRIDRFVVTTRRGIATLHKNPVEACDADERDRVIDEFEAEAMLIRSDAKPCPHCGFKKGY